jgi:acyl carrier protein
MDFTEIKKFFDKEPRLWRITPDLIKKVTKDKFNMELDPNKTWEDNGMDDLDIIAVIMEIEKELSVYIPDELGEIIYNSTPNIIGEILMQNRNNKINDLGIE